MDVIRLAVPDHDPRRRMLCECPQPIPICVERRGLKAVPLLVVEETLDGIGHRVVFDQPPAPPWVELAFFVGPFPFHELLPGNAPPGRAERLLLLLGRAVGIVEPGVVAPALLA